MSARVRNIALPVLLALTALAVPGTAVADGGRPDVSAPTTAATSITATDARLAGIVDSESGSAFHVEIGRTSSYGFSTATYYALQTVPVQVWVTVHGFAPATTYQFRVVATNSNGTTYGPNRSFTTLAGATSTELLTETAPLTPPAAPAPTSTSPASSPLSTPDLAPPLVAPAADGPSGSPADDASGAAPVLLPQASQSVVVAADSGSVSIQTPGSRGPVPLTGADRIPVGSIIDARHGALELSVDTGANVDTGRFWGASFRVTQPADGAGIAELTLLDGTPSYCNKPAGAARAHAASSKAGGLWGKDHMGRFRTRGRNSVATVRGTVWYVAERCGGTLTRVLKGAVEVRDMHRGVTVVVKAGHHMMVRDAARSAARRR